MKKLITEFNQTGNCTIDVAKVVKAWTNKFSISQYHEEYRLIKQGRGQNCAKVTISKEQAEMLIDKLKLLPIQSGMLRHGRTYRTESNIISEMERIQKIQSEKQSELSVINSVINEFQSALAKKIN
jgi:hypothetical protein